MGLFIGEISPAGHQCPTGWLWIKPVETGLELYDYTDGTWVLRYTVPLSSHTHEGLDQLPDIVTLLNNGITGSKTVGGYKFTFNHGILTGFEAV